MAVRKRREVTAMGLSDTEENIFPLIPHVTPIWPLDKRIEKMKARKPSFWRRIRNKMIVLRFLQGLNPTMTDLFLQVTNEDEQGSNIVTLTRDFREDQRRKVQRICEIQTDAFLRAENKKSEWEKMREREWPSTRTALPAVNYKRNSKFLTSKSEILVQKDRAIAKTRRQPDIQIHNPKEDSNSTKPEQRKQKAQSFRSLKEEFGFPERTDEIYSPGIWRNGKSAQRPINDPRFERLLKVLIPPSNETQKGFTTNTNESHSSVSKENKKALSARLGRKSPNEKWQETRVAKQSDKNVPKSIRIRNKFARPVGGLWPDQINTLFRVAKSY